MSRRLFSVVIPLYNKGPQILDTVQSVLSQDFQEFEVVIIDDGSTDDGPERVKQFTDDPRIRIIHQVNAGEGAARNAGIDAARYNWIAPLDADDLWLSGYLSGAYEAIREFPNAGMICLGGVSRFPDGSGYVRHVKGDSINCRKVDFFEAPFFFGNASSIVFLKDLVSTAGRFPANMPQRADVVFFFRLALVTDVVFCPALLMVYNLGVPGQVGSDRGANIAGIVDSSNQIYGFWSSLDADQRDPMCVSAMLLDFRGGLRYALTQSDYQLMKYFFEETDPCLISSLTTAERYLYPRPRLRWASLLLSRAFGLRRRFSRAPSPRFSSDVMNVIPNRGGI